MAAACSGGDDDDDAQGADGSSGNGQLKVSMPVIPPNFVHVMPWVAQDQGFYDDFGVDVELVSLDSGVTALRGAEAGSADIAAVPTPTLINAVAQGGSAKAFYTYSPNLDVQMVVSEDIGSCEELEGQVVGVDVAGRMGEAWHVEGVEPLVVALPGLEDVLEAPELIGRRHPQGGPRDRQAHRPVERALVNPDASGGRAADQKQLARLIGRDCRRAGAHVPAHVE